ncbi:MAG: PEP-CTERM sorting domain-containing protein [Verrucomicrobia bacterium]|nr:PEP-CTERM sorting domain-containing protein [Verrucomicrobiota bacterium]
MPFLARLFALVLSTGLLATAVSAQQVTANYSASPNLAIPDGSTVGLVSTIQVSGSSILEVTSIQVNLNISGGFNGDYYAYLVHYLPNGSPAGIVSLLNRSGRTGSNAFGYGDAGFNVTFAHGAPNGDIHLYQQISNPAGGVLTGLWQPDGRSADPLSVTDASPRTDSLLSFNGFAADGEWSLYLADVSALGTGTFVSWGMTIVGVPEPGTWAAGGLALLTLVQWRRRRA